MDGQIPTPDPPVVLPATGTRPTLEQRVVAAIEVLLCSDYPTQLLLGATLAALGFQPQTSAGTLDKTFVVLLSLADTVLLVSLIVVFLLAHGERPRDVFLGGRPVLAELRAGIPMTFVVFAIAVVVLVLVRALAPGLHTVERNPLQDLIRTPADRAIFAVVVVLAGGLREELQRAFLLHRFEGSLGGRQVGIMVTSAVFGLGHLLQGADAAVTTGLLGAFWGITYFRRRSAVAPMVSHSGFNLLQLAQFVAIAR